MSNSLVTVFCATAVCCQLEGYFNWAAAFLVIAGSLAVWNNLQWGKVFKAVTKIMEARRQQ